jgi:hypothetical protein
MPNTSPFPSSAQRLPIPRPLYDRLYARLLDAQRAEGALRETITIAAETMGLGVFEFLGVDEVDGKTAFVIAGPAEETKPDAAQEDPS